MLYVQHFWKKHPLRKKGHEVIKAAYEKYDKMCEDEDNDLRPIHPQGSGEGEEAGWRRRPTGTKSKQIKYLLH